MIASHVKKMSKWALNFVPGLFGWDMVPVNRKNPYFVFYSNMLSCYWNRDPEISAYKTSLERVDNAWTDNISKRFRYYSLYQNTIAALERNQGKGDVAECGVWKGHSAHMIATILKSWGFKEKFLIFDSFEGLSDLTHYDLNERIAMSEKQIEAQRDMLSCSEDIVRANLSEFDFLEFFPGWIPARFDEVADRQFILAHLDVDLYQPYHDSIEFFFPRLVEGGMMAFDDYGLTQFPGAKTAIDEALARFKPSHFYKIPSGGAYLIK